MWAWAWAVVVVVVVLLLGWGCWSEWRGMRRVDRTPLPPNVTGETVKFAGMRLSTDTPLWANLPTAEYPPVPLTPRGLAWLPTPLPDSPPADTVELPAIVEPTVEPVDELPGQTLGEQVLFDPYAVLHLGSREVHRGCLAARRDGKAPCGTCAPVLTGPADSPQWRRPR